MQLTASKGMLIMDEIIKLHLGCGKRYLPGYVHVDIDNFNHIDYQSTVDDLSMFKTNSVSEIYASHLLEYYDIYESLEVLKEWKRVLITGGELKVAVPDFQNLVKVYSSTKNISDVIGPIVGRWEVSKSQKIYHKQIFDFKSLKSLLEKAGFQNISSWDWKEFILDFPDYDDHSQAYFPHMDKDNGIHVSLNLVCYK